MLRLPASDAMMPPWRAGLFHWRLLEALARHACSEDFRLAAVSPRTLLIACAGYRDPFYDAGNEVRHTDAEPRHSAWTREMANGFGTNHRWGPLATALSSFKDRGCPFEEVMLLFAPGGRMNDRVEACKHHLRQFLSNNGSLISRCLESCDPADYGSALGSVRNAIRSAECNLRGRAVSLLLGPGTPQLNLALAFMSVSVLPKAKLLQVKHPAEVAKLPHLESMPPRSPVIELAFGSGRLPSIAIRGEPSARERKLEEDVRKLRAALTEALALRSGHDIPFTRDGTLKDTRENFERSELLNAIASERRAALSSGRKPKKTAAARILGITRQDFDSRLKRLGLTW